jgi:cell division septum initiation protein DivIVA
MREIEELKQLNHELKAEVEEREQREQSITNRTKT